MSTKVLLPCLLLSLAAAPLAIGQHVQRLPSPYETLTDEPVASERIDAGPHLDAGVAEIDLGTPAEPAPRWYAPSFWFGPTPWDTGFELGLNGSSGTSDVLSTRVGGFLKRKSKTQKLNASLYHNRTKTFGEETQNNALFDFRHDWLMADSPWSVFFLNQTFYDEFQAFDLNVNVNTGLGYQWVETDFWKFGTSVGAGASRKFGGNRNDWTPEAQLGMKWEQAICDTQKFYAKLDYFPQIQDLNQYRMMTDIGWEVELSRPSNVSLKFSLSDRFDSQPEGFNPHNTNYSVLLLWKK